jgi:histidine triad (HIT) family protein
MACIFCQIVDHKIPSARIYEDPNVIVISDLHPQAERHFLVIPKAHVTSLAENFDDEAKGRTVVAQLFSAANAVAKQEGLLPAGYRSVINTGADSGQSVFHLHLHILGGGKLSGRFA